MAWHYLLPFLLSGTLAAQGPPSSLEATAPVAAKSWRIPDGLLDPVVEALLEGPDHYLWIGTPSGLIRFDGETFQLYQGEGQEVLARGVTCLTLTSDGSVFAGTDGGGLVRFHGTTVQIIGSGQGLQNPLVRAVLEDADHRLWVGTDHGLFVGDGSAFRYALPRERYPTLGSAALIQDRSGSIWSAGSVLLRSTSAGVTEYPLPSLGGSQRVKAIAEDSDGTMFVGAVSGLFKRSPGGRFLRVGGVPGSIRTLGRAPTGELTVGTAGFGAYIRHGNRFDRAAFTSMFPSQTLLSSVRDTSGDSWFGTQGGLTRLSRASMNIVPLPTASADFATITPDTDGSMWFCSNGVFHLHGEVPTPFRFAGLSHTIARTVLRDADGGLWVGTAGNGAFRFKDGTSTLHLTREIGTNYIRGFLQSKRAGVWIATDGGVSLWQHGQTTNFHEIEGAPHTLVFSMSEQDGNKLWVGTPRGLFLLENGHYRDLPANLLLAPGPVWSVHADDNDGLWLGTNTGLYYWHNGTLSHAPIASDEVSQAIVNVMESPEGWLWLSGPTRVLRVLRADLERAILRHEGSETLAFRNESVTDNFPSAELFGGMQSSGVAGSGGSAWFASSQGPLHVLEETKDVVAIQSLFWRRVLVDGTVHPSSKLLVLPAGTKTLEVDYSVLMLPSQSGVRFRQRLEPFGDWLKPTIDRSASYANLSAGKYVLEVQAVDANGHPIASLSLPFVQRGYFYQQAWFWALCAAVTLLLFLGLHRLRLQRVRESLLALAAERARLAREMHDTLIQGCTAVSALLEAIAGRYKGEREGTEWLLSARNQIKTTITEARAAVWDLRTQDGSETLENNLRKMTRRETSGRSLEIHFRMQGQEPRLPGSVTYELTMGTREALLNAVMHSAAVRIDLSLKCSPGEVEIMIEDDGVGFRASDSATDGHFGLLGMRERMQRIGGKCSIASAQGLGTVVRFDYSNHTKGSGANS